MTKPTAEIEMKTCAHAVSRESVVRCGCTHQEELVADVRESNGCDFQVDQVCEGKHRVRNGHAHMANVVGKSLGVEDVPSNIDADVIADVEQVQRCDTELAVAQLRWVCSEYCCCCCF